MRPRHVIGGTVLALVLGAVLLLRPVRQPEAVQARGDDLPQPRTEARSHATATVAPTEELRETRDAEPARQEIVSETPPVFGTLRVRVRRTRDGGAVVGMPCAFLGTASEVVLRREAITGLDGDALFTEVVPAEVEVRLDELDRRTVRVEAGREAVVEFALAQVLTIDGLVVDETAAPVAGARVNAIRHADWPVPDRSCMVATTGADGRFTAAIVGVPWVLRAEKDARRSALVSPGTGGGALIGDGVSRVTLVVAPAAVTVRGSVFLGSGGLADAGVVTLVAARGSSSRPRAMLERDIESARVEADGSYELRARAGGPAELTVAVPGCASTFVPVTLPAAGVVTIDATVEPGARLAGFVRDDGGRPLAGARVLMLRKGSSTAITEARTRGDGSYALADAPRNLPLAVHASALLHDSDEWRVTALLAEQRRDFVLARLDTIRGRLLRADGTPLAGWRVEARVRGERDQRPLAKVAADGSFAAAFARGATVQLFAIPEQTNLRVPLVGGRALPASGERLQDFVLRDEDLPNAYVRGRVAPAPGVQAGGGAVALYLFDGVTRARNAHRVAADGSFVVGPVPARRYRLLARVDGGEERELMQFALASGQQLDLGDVRWQ